MRNLFLFIWRSHVFILFLLLEIFCVYFIVKNNKYQRASFINSTNTISAQCYNTLSNVTEYIHLKASNEMLANENSRLRALIPNAHYNNLVTGATVNDTIYKQQYTYITAKVINNSTNKRNNYLTLNRGHSHGIKPEMAVISSNGVVGIVKDVSDNYCTVLSLLHKDTKISAKIAKNEYFGSLIWEGGNAQQATLLDIPKHVTLNIGDQLVTTSYSSIFPEGINIGTISSFEVKPGDNFYTIQVNLATSFQNISYVYVVNNLMKKEQKQLENLIQSNDQ